MKSKRLREELMIAFQIDNWDRLNSLIQEATAPYPVKLTWECIARAKSRNGHHCVIGYALQFDPHVTGHFIQEEFTFVRFAGSERIWRYQNGIEMKHELSHFDEFNLTDGWEGGDIVTLEAVGTARSREYANNRRKAIKAGTHKVKERGPNLNMRREPRRHFRPF